MGKLADDMIRLGQEILELRTERQRFVKDLKASVDELRTGFLRQHAQMARESRAARKAILQDLAAARDAWSRLAMDSSRQPVGKPDAVEEELQRAVAEGQRQSGGSGPKGGGMGGKKKAR